MVDRIPTSLPVVHSSNISNNNGTSGITRLSSTSVSRLRLFVATLLVGHVSSWVAPRPQPTRWSALWTISTTRHSPTDSVVSANSTAFISVPLVVEATLSTAATTSTIQSDVWLVPSGSDNSATAKTARLLQRRQRSILSTPPTTLGPDPATKPDYENLVGPLGRFMDTIFTNVFCDKLAEQVLGDVILYQGDDDTNNNNLAKQITTTAYDRWKKERTTTASFSLFGWPTANFTDIVQLAAALNARFANDPTEVQRRAQRVLERLFPSWLPPHYAFLFARPFPAWSARMNAHVTAAVGVWLMGECTVNDIPLNGVVAASSAAAAASDDRLLELSSSTNTNTSLWGRQQGVLVTRCRFLEESGCASVCVNSCQIPTQTFFRERMGLALTMEPDYETGSCQFSFGRHPDLRTEAAAWATPCLAHCPTAGSYRSNHDGGLRGSSSSAGDGAEELTAAVQAQDSIINNCFRMGARLGVNTVLQNDATVDT